MTPNQLIGVLNNLTPEERDLPMLIHEDLFSYYNEDIRSVVVERDTSGDPVVCVSACVAKAITFCGTVTRVVWEVPYE